MLSPRQVLVILRGASLSHSERAFANFQLARAKKRDPQVCVSFPRLCGIYRPVSDTRRQLHGTGSFASMAAESPGAMTPGFRFTECVFSTANSR